MRLLALLITLSLPALLVAAPVPKEKAKTTEQKLIGKWRMPLDEATADLLPADVEYFILFKEEGEVEVRVEYDGGKKAVTYTGAYKLTDDLALEYTVVKGRGNLTASATIDKLTDTELVWTNSDKHQERLKRVKDEKKDEKKKDK